MTSQRKDIPFETESTRLKEAFGATVTARRKKLNFDQREFARIAGISNSHLRKIEGGETSPMLTTVAKIAAALGTDAVDLVDEACRRVKEAEAKRGFASENGARLRPIKSTLRADYSTTRL